jgi:hypothetical protein
MKMFANVGLPTEFGSAVKKPADTISASGTVTDEPLPATGTVEEVAEVKPEAFENLPVHLAERVNAPHDVTKALQSYINGVGNRPEDATGADVPEHLRTRTVPVIEDKPAPGYTRWDVEHTDTFGEKWSGNYCWVTRHTFDLPDNAPDVTVVRKAKELLGLTGVKCDKQDMGDSIALSPRNNTVVFITPRF